MKKLWVALVQYYGIPVFCVALFDILVYIAVMILGITRLIQLTWLSDLLLGLMLCHAVSTLLVRIIKSKLAKIFYWIGYALLTFTIVVLCILITLRIELTIDITIPSLVRLIIMLYFLLCLLVDYLLRKIGVKKKSEKKDK